MAKRQEFRQNRDSYTLRFNDDEHGVVWTTGNLTRFLRNLWNANPILRELNKDRTAREFANRISSVMYTSLYNSGTGTSNFYLVPRTAKGMHRTLYAGKITKNVMKAIKVIA